MSIHENDDRSPELPPTFRWIDPAQADAHAVLERLLKEAASVVPGLSPDEKLTDPLVRLLLAAVSREYARLYAKLDGVIDLSYRKLVESLLSFPRGPRPTSTVLHLTVKDAGTVIDENLQVVGRKALGGADGHDERSIHFSPAGEETLSGVPSPTLVLQETDSARLLAEGGEAPGTVPSAGREWATDPEPGVHLHLGFDVPPEPVSSSLPLFLVGDETTVGGLLWSRWEAGPAGETREFVPGVLRELHPWHESAAPRLFCSRTDQSRPDSVYDRFFVRLDPTFLLAGQGVRYPAVLGAIEAGYLPSVPQRCWIKVTVPESVSARSLWTLRALTNCVVAFNVNRQFASFNLGTEPFQSVELPVAFRDLFRLDEVHDSANGDVYADAEGAQALGSDHRYHLDTSASGKALLRLSSRAPTSRPRKIEVSYATTYGDAADGLGTGSVDVIYDARLTPGVAEAVNVVPSAGGSPAGVERHHADELRAVLATRGRATTRHDYLQLARAYDPRRVADVAVERGVVQTPGGVTSCVHVRVTPASGVFHGTLERESFRKSLHEYLQARAPAGQPVLVSLEETP